MAPDGRSEREALRLALTPGDHCPPVGALESALDGDTAPADLMRHIASCSFCQAELELLRAFQTPPRDGDESEAVRLVAARLKSPSSIAPPPPSYDPWWKRWSQARWMSPAAFAMAGVLIAAAIGVQWTQRAPRLQVPDPAGQEALRSGGLTVLAPLGDIAEAPAEIRWEPLPAATQYEVRLLEVDGTELWNASASQPRLELPVRVRALAVPAKTLLVEVKALDSRARVVAESEPVRFRVLQKLYKR